MQDNDYPDLCQSAEALSESSQKSFFRCLGAQLFALILAAFISALNSTDSGPAYFQVAAMCFALVLSVYMATAKPDKDWYAARALAESVKTISWRFVMRAEPYDAVTAAAESHFLETLKDIQQQNPTVNAKLNQKLDGVVITPRMSVIRNQGFEGRKSCYLTDRVKHQLEWYSNKATTSKLRASASFWVLCSFNAIAIGLCFYKVAHPATAVPMDMVFTAAACILTWTQAKRFSDLSASYTQTANEIAFVLAEGKSILEADFSRYVGDSENAFSREHTQWVARRDK